MQAAASQRGSPSSESSRRRRRRESPTETLSYQDEADSVRRFWGPAQRRQERPSVSSPGAQIQGSVPERSGVGKRCTSHADTSPPPELQPLPHGTMTPSSPGAPCGMLTRRPSLNRTAPLTCVDPPLAKEAAAGESAGSHDLANHVHFSHDRGAAGGGGDGGADVLIRSNWVRKSLKGKGEACSKPCGSDFGGGFWPHWGGDLIWCAPWVRCKCS